MTSAPTKIDKFEVERPLGRGFSEAAFVGRRAGPIRPQTLAQSHSAGDVREVWKNFEEEVRHHAEVAANAEFIVGVEDMFDADIDFVGTVLPCHVVELAYVDGGCWSNICRAACPSVLRRRRRSRPTYSECVTNSSFGSSNNDLYAANIVVERLPKAAWR